MKTNPTQVDVLLCVGCGGVFYHGLTQLSTFVARRPDMRIVLMDGDRIEARNSERQWTYGVGDFKAMAARTVLSYMEVGGMVVGIPAMFIEGDVALAANLVVGEDEVLRRLVVVGAPDNHLCRKLIYEECRELANKKPEIEITAVVAGNSVTDGYAYGAVFQGETVKNDWMLRHPDIGEEAREEEEQLAHPEGCGSLPETPEQSSGGNHMTAYLMWKTAENCLKGTPTDMFWVLQEDGSVRISSRVWTPKREVIMT